MASSANGTETHEETPPQPAGIVERLARDDVDRKRFLKMAGSAGAASFGAFVLAACGSSSSSSKSTTAAGTATSASSSAGGDIAIVNYALTLEYLESEFYAKVIASGAVQRQSRRLLQDVRQPGGLARRRAESGRDASWAGRRRQNPNGKFPITSATQVAKLAYTVENLGAAAYLGQAGEDPEPGDPRRGACDPHGRGAPRGDARHAREEVRHPAWRIRHAG